MITGYGILRRRRPISQNWFFGLLLAAFLAPAGAAPASPGQAGTLRNMSSAFEALAARVSPAVVEVLVSGYGIRDTDSGDADAPISRQSSLGSGVIIDPDGYIVTNHHVIEGARKVAVVLTPAMQLQGQVTAALRSRSRVLPARVIGFNRATDLAVLKVEATGLPTVPIAAYDTLRQGQIVLAFGSPLGLKNSVSLGLVSAVLRQDDPDNPMVYIQTDAAINPGNSGGALVDVDGNLVGINASILTVSGGNEGVGFAIPSGIVRYVYEQIRRYGYVRTRSIGASLQTVTPELAAALRLSSDRGVIVSDVVPGGPAERAGIRPYDRIESIDGNPVDSVPTFVMSVQLHPGGKKLRLGVQHGNESRILSLEPAEHEPVAESLVDLANPDTDRIRELNIVAIDVSAQAARLLPSFRGGSGAIVAATTAEDIGLRVGDVIRAFNAEPVASVAQLRAELRGHRSGDPVALQVERNGWSTFVTFEID